MEGWLSNAAWLDGGVNKVEKWVQIQSLPKDEICAAKVQEKAIQTANFLIINGNSAKARGCEILFRSAFLAWIFNWILSQVQHPYPSVSNKLLETNQKVIPHNLQCEVFPLRRAKVPLSFAKCLLYLA
jgi:hypothetical protein